MLVFGDHVRRRDPRDVIEDLDARLVAIARMPRGLARHAALVGAFIEASELAQGLADAERALRGVDARSPMTDAAMHVLVSLAQAIDASWTGRITQLGSWWLRVLRAVALPDRIKMKRAEGYAFYAVYPEAYIAAARRAGIVDRRVIGIRSIGTGLAALVAAASGAPLPATLRPYGNPFAREVSASPELVAEWSKDRHARIAIADEGPGLSGSSFGAVADLLERNGVDRTRIEMFPSHRGEPGPAASAHHRARWAKIARHVVDADELLVTTQRLAGWVAGLVGPPVAPLEDISGGHWRARHYGREHAWPPSIVHQERRKFLVHTRDGTWLAKFVGLGRTGEHALVRARLLHAAGFTSEVAGLCHGFLVERWLDDARPLDARAIDRTYLIERAGAYLGMRARWVSSVGATSSTLIEMVRRNVSIAVDTSTAVRIAGRLVPRPAVAVEIDGKLQAWEWLVRGDGTLVKADAYDHHAAHDLIGCQDIAWDLVGAAIELGLDPNEQERLARRVEEEAGRSLDRELVAFMRPCYLAFQLGRATLGAQSCAGAEALRLQGAAARYARLLIAT
ncbi:MAG: hypothetical protein HOV81_11680 [Kofleriaceae bacterium]|nr:hypothetical protein [Kofleriaceae bacterium]